MYLLCNRTNHLIGKFIAITITWWKLGHQTTCLGINMALGSDTKTSGNLKSAIHTHYGHDLLCTTRLSIRKGNALNTSINFLPCIIK